MKHFLFGLLWGVLGLLVAACSPATLSAIQTTTAPTTAPASGPTTTPLRAPRNVYTPTEFDRLYYPTDLNLVGITGRPQFINSYADW